ncbi:hypothetical protein IFO70_14305 [Phormidium tenue FACHB-886]|nr:hypothetical protein [Phormidium tenue FACHB-886]
MAADLSGTWLGTYWQDGSPTRFEATLVQGGNSFSGRILDDNLLGEAQITGELIGRSIRFTKQYLTGTHRAIRYSGTLSEDANFMQGDWNIDRSHSGVWEAHRNQDDLMADLKNRLAQQTPVVTS